jgi:hypothetical protein
MIRPGTRDLIQRVQRAGYDVIAIEHPRNSFHRFSVPQRFFSQAEGISSESLGNVCLHYGVRKATALHSVCDAANKPTQVRKECC